VAAAERSPELGAAWLAAEMSEFPKVGAEPAASKIDDLAAALTEQRNPRSENLEKMSAKELVELFVTEEKFVQEALRKAIVDLTRAVELVAECLRKGGRLFYVGAGSSGRIAVLDASEIPPTFGARPELVQGIIAGGVTALHRSVEGAEDEASNGALAIDERGIKENDVVIGVTASGRTPFVLAALAKAKARGAKTILLSCNPDAPGKKDVDLAIGLAVGPEILTGSTRLKAGTATKVALNIISTGAMVALGKVRGNFMIDLHASSTKLRDRAVRLVAQLTESDYNSAREKLEAANWNLRAVVDKIEK
ncbi:MAG TPA: N-acetylmuramic acid 6-phosphate etherase, partial [Chthoniobacterales bacterium]|nr:N-acetylmuramic acid 6-phosphate etherase [Chthoniobacterales bacterium]